MIAESWEAAIELESHTVGTPRELLTAIELRDAEIKLGAGKRARLFRPVKGSIRIPLPRRQSGDNAPRALLSRDGRTGYERSLSQVTYDDLVGSHPMRTFSRRMGQSNKPVAFYCRTVGDLITCESQHERRFVILADFHQKVVHIAAQPFTLDFPSDSEVTTHTPDFALICASGAIIIVDVKWHLKALNEITLRRHEIVKNTLARAGMQHFVWTNAPLVVTENLANFAAARVPDAMMLDLVPKLLSVHRPGMRVKELIEMAARVHGVPASTVLVALRRMLWEHQFTVDTLVRFNPEVELMRP